MNNTILVVDLEKSTSRTGLVQQLVTYVRGGKVITRKQWVRSEGYELTKQAIEEKKKEEKRKREREKEEEDNKKPSNSKNNRISKEKAEAEDRETKKKLDRKKNDELHDTMPDDMFKYHLKAKKKQYLSQKDTDIAQNKQDNKAKHEENVSSSKEKGSK